MKRSGYSFPRPVPPWYNKDLQRNTFLIRSLRHFQGRLREVSLVAVLACVSGCAGNYHLVPAPAPFSHPSLGVTWLTPGAAGDAAVLSRWRVAVGQPVITNLPPVEAPLPVDTLTIISWNMALGEGISSRCCDACSGIIQAPRSCCCSRKHFAAATMCRPRR